MHSTWQMYTELVEEVNNQKVDPWIEVKDSNLGQFVFSFQHIFNVYHTSSI